MIVSDATIWSVNYNCNTFIIQATGITMVEHSIQSPKTKGSNSVILNVREAKVPWLCPGVIVVEFSIQNPKMEGP